MIGLVALTFMMALTVADVLMRYCFRAPIPGASELTELMLVIIVFFAVADTHSVKGHVAVDLVVSHLAPHTRAAIAFIVSCLSLATAAFPGTKGRRFWNNWRRFQPHPNWTRISAFRCRTSSGRTRTSAATRGKSALASSGPGRRWWHYLRASEPPSKKFCSMTAACRKRFLRSPWSSPRPTTSTWGAATCSSLRIRCRRCRRESRRT